MRDDFDGASAPFEPTIDTLATEYGLGGLSALYRERKKGIVLMEFQGLTLSKIHLRNADCKLVFSYRNDVAMSQREGLLEGFRLDLVEENSGEILLSALHAETPGRPGIFSIMGAGVAEHLETLPLWQTESPPELLCELIRSADQRQPAGPKPVLH